jgi:hypothetical protein
MSADASVRLSAFSAATGPETDCKIHVIKVAQCRIAIDQPRLSSSFVSYPTDAPRDEF